jgi:putative endonuclease
MPFVYILECSDGTYYNGSTWNLEERLYQHQTGIGSNHTKVRLPVKLVISEEFDRVDEAYAREKQIQGWSHQKKKALIEGNFEGLIKFSKNYSQNGKPKSTKSV